MRAHHAVTKGLRVRVVKVVAAGLGVILAGTLLFAGPASAQIPDLPDLPDLPPEAQEAIRALEDALIPVLVDVASELQVVSNAVGFALRPGCAVAGTAVILLTLLGGNAPVSLGFWATPVLMFCAGAFTEGPADPLFAEVDELAALAEGCGRRLMPIMQLRFGNGLRQLQHLIARGVPGRAYIATIETHWSRGPDYYASPWRGRQATELGGKVAQTAGSSATVRSSVISRSSTARSSNRWVSV
jgi:hypothetical protein